MREIIMAAVLPALAACEANGERQAAGFWRLDVQVTVTTDRNATGSISTTSTLTGGPP